MQDKRIERSHELELCILVQITIWIPFQNYYYYICYCIPWDMKYYTSGSVKYRNTFLTK